VVKLIVSSQGGMQIFLSLLSSQSVGVRLLSLLCIARMCIIRVNQNLWSEGMGGGGGEGQSQSRESLFVGLSGSGDQGEALRRGRPSGAASPLPAVFEGKCTCAIALTECS
jgi:hypothetical protein